MKIAALFLLKSDAERLAIEIATRLDVTDDRSEAGDEQNLGIVQLHHYLSPFAVVPRTQDQTSRDAPQNQSLLTCPGALLTWRNRETHSFRVFAGVGTCTIGVWVPRNGGVERRDAKPSGRLERVLIRQVNGWLPTRVLLAKRHGLAELLGKRDNDALRGHFVS